MLVGKHDDNIYMMGINHASSGVECLLTKDEDSWLQHRKIAYILMHLSQPRSRRGRQIKMVYLIFKTGVSPP